jgi:N utilization substance protein B
LSDFGAQRHLARERALEIYYEASVKERPLGDVVNELASVPDSYTLVLLGSVIENEAATRELISRNLIDWTFERVALVDRLVLTLALSELMLDDAPPRAVVLDEAVELAKVFSTEQSPSFVNGVLTACVDELLL